MREHMAALDVPVDHLSDEQLIEYVRCLVVQVSKAMMPFVEAHRRMGVTLREAQAQMLAARAAGRRCE